jgi:paraquat-inducible protein B
MTVEMMKSGSVSVNVSAPPQGTGKAAEAAVVSTLTMRERMGSTVVGSTEAALDEAAQAIEAIRANLVAVSRKQAVTEALSEALQTIKNAKANLMYGAEGGTKALQQNLEQAIAELKAEIAGIDDRLCPCSSTAAPTGTVARRALEGGGQALATPSGGLG